jgi:hypothetical protein
MGDAALKEFYIRNSDIFVNNEIPIWIMREVGWFLFKGIVWVAAKCQDLYDISFGLIDFTSWSNVNEYVSALKPLFIALTAISLFALGIIFIFLHEKKPKIIINICLAVLCVTCSTVVFGQLNDATKAVKKGFESITVNEKGQDVYDIVGENIIDLVYLDQKNEIDNLNYETQGKDLSKPSVNEKNFKQIDYGEVLNPKTEKKWNSNDDADLANEFYYRYHFSFFLATLQLLAIIVLYVALAYKCVRVIFELVVARLFAYLYAAELSGGEKLKKILMFIRDSYILLLVTVLCVRVFFLFNAYITTTIDNTFVQGVLIVFLAFAVIDGPNLVEKLLGMDAGLSSSTSRMLAAYGAVKGAATVGAKVGGTIGGKAFNIAKGSNKPNPMDQKGPAGAGSSGGKGEPSQDGQKQGRGQEAGGDEQQRKNMEYMDSGGKDKEKDKESPNLHTSQDEEKAGEGPRVYSGEENHTDFMDETGSHTGADFMEGSTGKIDSMDPASGQTPKGMKPESSRKNSFMDKPKERKYRSSHKPKETKYESDLLKNRKDKK